MSKTPEHRNSCSKIQSSKTWIKNTLDNGHTKPSPINQNASNIQDNKIKVQTSKKPKDQSPEYRVEKGRDLSNVCTEFDSITPKINLENIGEKSVQNPRILDLRNKLNEINKKREKGVDKETKSLLNHITQLVDEDELSDSGPYSILLDLTNEGKASSTTDCFKPNNIANSALLDFQVYNKTEFFTDTSLLHTPSSSGERKPNVVNVEEISVSEFEYSCATASLDLISDKQIRGSRSGLCLHFTNSTRNNKSELSPQTDNSLHRPNDEHSLDDSLGILTPDQMDDMFSPTVEELPVFGNEFKSTPDNGETPSTEKTETNSPVSTMYVENDLQVPEELTSRSITIERPDAHLSNQNTDLQSTIHLEKNNFNEATNYMDVTMIHLEESDLQFGESDGKELLAEKSSDNTKDTIFMPNADDDFLLSVNSSILEPASSAVDTHNLELPFDSKNQEHFKNHPSQRIEQTPSPEDLPLDLADINEETISNSLVSPPLLDSHVSETKTDLGKSMETSKVSSSFITSITSITSLDGYQGDGEMSRPVSRGGDQSGIKDDQLEMNWQNVPVNRRQDPMTDSDFFTESDADGHEDHMHKGDRRAQVIDGALYGGKNPSPLIVNRTDDSCMDSSGIYTDLETHLSSPVFLNAIEDMSPDGSSPSTHSECSQKSGNNKSLKSVAENGSIKSRTSLVLEADLRDEDKSLHKSMAAEIKSEKTKEEKKSFSLKKYKMPKRDVPSKLKTMLSRKPDSDTSSENSPSSKMKKMERREVTQRKLNVDGKVQSFKDIKSKVDCCFTLQRSQTACGVTRTLSSKATAAVKPKARHSRTRLSELGTGPSGKSSLHSSQSDVSATSSPPAKLSSRFPSSRTTKKRDGVAATGAGVVAVGGGITSPRTPASPHTPSHPPSNAAKKPNGTPLTPLPTPAAAALPKLSGSPVSTRARLASAAPPPAPASPRKPSQRRALPAARPNTLPANVKDPVRSGSVRTSKRAATQQQPTPPAQQSTPAAVRVAPPPANAALSHAAKGVEALAVLVQYLVCQLESLNADGWRAEVTRWRGLAAAERTTAARAAHQHQQRAQKDLDTIGECLSKISQLEMEVSRQEESNSRLQAAGLLAEQRYADTLQDIAALSKDINSLKSTIGSLKASVCESRALVCAGVQRERELAAQLEAARRDLALAHIERHPDLDKEKTDLVAEVRSLRAVLELKQGEASELRQTRGSLDAECERRAAAERELEALRRAGEELRERAAARQRDADALREENRRLRECAVRDQQAHARLTLYNEELRYKLRQKSQVVSLLATNGGGYAGSCSSPRARAASCGSPPDTPSPSASPSPPALPDTPPGARCSPAVKGVVEKHDSVSWVLEIEESPEEVADRIARRSSSFRSPGGGVKRRGGGSPGAPGSPLPASPAPNASKLFRCSGERAADLSAPPLKESAGEAIYIYDNRQF